MAKHKTTKSNCKNCNVEFDARYRKKPDGTPYIQYFCSKKCLYAHGHTEEAKLAMSIAATGHIKTEAHRANLSKALKGRQIRLGYKNTPEQNAKIGKANAIALKGRKLPEDVKQKVSEALTGMPKSQAHKDAISRSKKGSNHPNWKGGKTKLVMSIRQIREYKTWRTSIFERDNYTCQECGKRGGKLNADHIIPLSHLMKGITTLKEALQDETLWNLENGRTLCVVCHLETDTYGHKATTYRIPVRPHDILNV